MTSWTWRDRRSSLHGHKSSVVAASQLALLYLPRLNSICFTNQVPSDLSRPQFRTFGIQSLSLSCNNMKIFPAMLAALGLTPCVQGVVLVYHSITYSISPIIRTGLSVQDKVYPIGCGQLDNSIPDSCTVDGNTGSCSSKGYTANIRAVKRYDCNGRQQRPSDGKSTLLIVKTQTTKCRYTATVIAPNGDRIENVAQDSRCQPLCCGTNAYGTEVSAWQCKI